MESPVFNAADEVIQALSFHNPVEHYFVAFLAVAGEEIGIFAFCDPECVSQFQRAHNWRDASPDELVGDVVSIFLRTDLADVEDKFDCKAIRW